MNSHRAAMYNNKYRAANGNISPGYNLHIIEIFTIDVNATSTTKDYFTKQPHLINIMNEDFFMVIPGLCVNCIRRFQCVSRKQQCKFSPPGLINFLTGSHEKDSRITIEYEGYHILGYEENEDYRMYMDIHAIWVPEREAKRIRNTPQGEHHG